MDNHATFLDAVNRFIENYQAGRLDLRTAADMQSYLFFYCVSILSEQDVVSPFALHCDAAPFDPRERVDMLLGENEVAVMIMLEPDYPGLAVEQKPRVFSDDIERSFERMRDLCARGVPHGYVIILDEDGTHLRGFPNAAWQKLNTGQREVYLLTRHFQAGEG